MNIEKLFSNSSIMVSLDADRFLFDRVQQVIAAGISTVEIGSSDIEMLQQLMRAFPHVQFGAGNVVTIQQLEACYQAGLAFASSPGYVPAIANTAAIYSMNYLPGVATISEAMTAFHNGCLHVRPFPASLALCSLLNEYLPELNLYPGHVAVDEVEDFLNLPNVQSVSLHNPNVKNLNALLDVLAA
ncbi:MAG: multidrug DMT transporter permease [Legionella sp.]|nr:MAG: multidrug DMT transporter permease [Legionella sp.]PJD99396.1 MAG: multidrug DMT transporter permease [Legionella sp.]